MMTNAKLEKIMVSVKNGKPLGEIGISSILYWAYKDMCSFWDMLNLDYGIKLEDIPELVQSMKDCDIREFTVSGNYHGTEMFLQELATFQRNCCVMDGLVYIKDLGLRHGETGEYTIDIPAIKFHIKD